MPAGRRPWWLWPLDVLALVFIALPAMCLYAWFGPRRRVIVPDGYVGWVELRWRVRGAPPAEREGRWRVLVVSVCANGRVDCCEGNGETAPPHFVYATSGREAPLASLFGAGGPPGPHSTWAFVGTEAQWLVWRGGDVRKRPVPGDLRDSAGGPG